MHFNFHISFFFDLNLSHKVQSAVVRLFNSVFLFVCLFQTSSLFHCRPKVTLTLIFFGFRAKGERLRTELDQIV